MEQIEGTILDDLEAELGYRATGYHRYSDQCSAQFKVRSIKVTLSLFIYFQSRFTVWKLFTAHSILRLAAESRISHHYYQQGHGKNQSDRLGNQGKSAYLRGISREPYLCFSTIDEVAELIQRHLPGKGKALFTKVMVIPPLKQPDKDSEGQIPVKGIQKINSIICTDDGTIIGQALSCKKCILQQVTWLIYINIMNLYHKELCSTCSTLKPLYTPGLDISDSSNNEAAEESDEELSELYEEEEDGELSGDDDKDSDDESDCQQDDDDDQDTFPPGSIVWAR